MKAGRIRGTAQDRSAQDGQLSLGRVRATGGGLSGCPVKGRTTQDPSLPLVAHSGGAGGGWGGAAGPRRRGGGLREVLITEMHKYIQIQLSVTMRPPALTLGGDVSSSTDAGILCRPSEVLLPALTTKMRIRMPSTSA
ncbi:unnamed protein product [Gadus morhua 'NCC']